MTGAILETFELTRRIISDVSVTLVSKATIQIFPGELTSISGPSGSGKSSLLYLLGLLDRPTEGKILLGGRDVSRYTEEERAFERLSTLGFVFQFHFLLPELSALENVRLPMDRLGKMPLKERDERAKTLLARMGLFEHAHKIPRQLSGGQAQRIAIARALANDPPLIFADEPTGNLDSKSAQSVQDLLLDLAHDQNRAVVVVTHDPMFSERADRKIHIVDGSISEVRRKN